MSTPAPAPIVLRTAAVWGTQVLAVRSLMAGQSFSLADGGDAVKPDGWPISDYPVRAVGGGWELDTRGSTGGALKLRGRDEDPAGLGRTGAPIPIVAGDHGIVQYGNFGVFFQFAHAPPMMRSKGRIDWALLFALLFASVAVVGAVVLLRLVQTPEALPKPLELTSREELLAKFEMDPEPEPPKPTSSDEKKGQENVGAKDKKETGGGKKTLGDEGRLGRNADKDETKQTGEIKHSLGGITDVLNSEVGKEVEKTLGAISSVSEALGGLNSDDVVLGRGPGLGLHGAGSGGGGDSLGVPFGSGTMDTGWGPGRGGGYGTGSGGPGGSGSGGKGDGAGSGTGASERKVAGGGDPPKTGQGLTPAQISRVVMSRFGAFQACYETASAREPNLKGGVSVSFSISPSGSVSSASIGSSSLGNPRVEGCLLRQFRRLQFPQADKPTGAGFPFMFRPKR